MKRLPTIAVSCILFAQIGLLSTPAFAQPAKRNWLIDASIGNFNLSDTHIDMLTATATNKQKDHAFSTALNPSMGYFLNPRFAIGLNLAIGFQQNLSKSYDYAGKQTSDTRSSSSSLGVAPFVRYYFAGKKALRWYGQVKAGYHATLAMKNETCYYSIAGDRYLKQFSTYPDKLHGISAEALLGINYFLSADIAFNSSIGYYFNRYRSSQYYTSVLLSSNTSTTGATSSLTQQTGNIAWNIGMTMIVQWRKNRNL